QPVGFKCMGPPRIRGHTWLLLREEAPDDHSGHGEDQAHECGAEHASEDAGIILVAVEDVEGDRRRYTCDEPTLLPVGSRRTTSPRMHDWSGCWHRGCLEAHP